MIPRPRPTRRPFAGSLIALALVALTGTISAMSSDAHSQDLRRLRGSIAIDGSSTVYPITEAIAEAFKKEAPNVNITVGVSGTGGGFKRFAANETDISDASRPIKPSESAKCGESGVGYLELPVAYDGLTIVVSRSNDWVDHLTVDELKKIFLTTDPAATWQDVRATWPATPLKIYSPGTDSGTFDYFKEVVAGKDGTIRSDMSVSEDDNALVMGVAGNVDGIGYFGLAYYEENQSKLRAVPIDGGKGPVAPSAKSVNDGTYTPLSRPLFIYVNRKSADRTEVQAFVDFYLKEAGELAKEVGYVNMPDEILARAKARWASRKTGTVFVADGKKVEGAFSTLYR